MANLLYVSTVFLLAVFLVLAPLVIHEMGHWVALRRYHVPVREYWLGLGPVLLKFGSFRIGMLPIGGALVPDEQTYTALAPRKRMVVALAGPLASVLYGFVFWCAALINQTIVSGEILFTIAYLSLGIAAINLLPIPPLDGFQAWASWREARNAPLSPTALHVSQRVGDGLVYGVGFFVLGLVFLR